MAGLLDMFMDPNAQMDPRSMGILGAIGAFGAANPPQAASRLPLAKPNMMYQLSQAAGGFGQGANMGTQMQHAQEQMKALQAQTQGQNLQNLDATQKYNFWAQLQGNPLLPMQQGATQAPPSAQMLSQTGAASPPSSTGMAAPSGAMPSPMAGSSAAPSSGQFNLQDIYKTTPPPVLEHYGFPVPAELKAAYAAGVVPGSTAWTRLAENAAVKAAGMNPMIGGDRPGVPAQQYNLQTGTYDVLPGQMDTMQKGAYASEYGKSQGGLPASEAKSAFDAGLRVNTENEIEKRKTFYQTGQTPPNYGAAAMPTTSPTGDIGTERGTIVPKAPAPSFIGSDAMAKQNTNTAETEKSFGSVRGGLEGTESRMVVLAQALKGVEGKGLNEAKAQASALLRGAGMSKIADQVMSAKDMSSVQTALGAQTLDILGQLKQINQGTGGKILNSEFTNLLDKQYGPDMSPEANYTLITQALAGIYQTRNLIDDYYKYGKPNGWRDANAFQSEYYGKKENSYAEMVKQAEKAVGPLRGMETPAANLPITDENIAHTAKLHGLTEEQVRRDFGGRFEDAR